MIDDLSQPRSIVRVSRRQFIRGALLASSGALLAACSQAAPTQAPAPTQPQQQAAQPTAVPTQAPVKPKETTKIVFADPKNIVAPQEEIPIVAVAKKLGYHAEEGLDIDMQSANGSTAALQLLASGSAQIAAADASSVIAARQAGQKVKGFFVLVRNWPWSVATLADGGITDLKELKGKNMGVISLQSGGVPYAKAMIKSAGLEPETDVPLVAVGQGAQAAAALQSKQVAAVTLYGAAYAALENAGVKLRYFNNPAIEQGLFSLVLAANEDYLKSNRAILVGFGRAAAKGLVFTQTNPQAAMKIGYGIFPQLAPKEGDQQKRLQDDTNVLKKWMESAVFLDSDPDKGVWGRKSEQAWLKTQQYFVDAGILKSKLDIAEVWDPSLLDDINKFDSQKVIDQAKNYQ